MSQMTIKALAQATGASSDAIRYYARTGLLAPQRDSSNGYRRFSHADAVRLKFIRRAKMLGYRLDEIRELVAASEQGESPCPLAREIIERRIHGDRKAAEPR